MSYRCSLRHDFSINSIAKATTPSTTILYTAQGRMGFKPRKCHDEGYDSVRYPTNITSYSICKTNGPFRACTSKTSVLSFTCYQPRHQYVTLFYSCFALLFVRTTLYSILFTLNRLRCTARRSLGELVLGRKCHQCRRLEGTRGSYLSHWQHSRRSAASKILRIEILRIAFSIPIPLLGGSDQM